MHQYIYAGFIMYNGESTLEGKWNSWYELLCAAPCYVVKYILQDRSFVLLFYSTGPGLWRMCYTISPEFRIRILYEPHYT